MTARSRRSAHLEALAHSDPRLTSEPMRVRFRLPWPPSVNHYWLSLRKGALAGRVVISAAGVKYRRQVGLEVMRQGVPRGTLRGKLGVTVMACPPDRRTRDLDNLLKSLLDSLAYAGVIGDDGDIDDLRIYRGPLLRDGLVHVEVVELQAAVTETLPLPLRDPILDQALAIMGEG